MQSKGGVVVTAAGNTHALDPTSPTNTLINVSSTNKDDTFSSYSTYGDIVELSAPGSGVVAATRTGGYGTFSGTSASAPTVAGSVALVMAAEPGLAPSEVAAVLRETAIDLGPVGKDQKFGYGRVNVGAAVAMAVGNPIVDITSPVVSSVSASGLVCKTINVTVGASDDFGVTKATLDAPGFHAEDTLAPYAFSWNTTTVPDGPVTLTARAYDAAWNVGSKNASTTVSNSQTPPVASVAQPANGATVTGKVTITVTANVKAKYMSIAIDGVIKRSGSNVSSTSYVWDTATASNGSHTIVGLARNCVGTSTTDSATVTKNG
jgi:subtilase family protein/Big-like domain-containing protein